jgi:hypothetical protein
MLIRQNFISLPLGDNGLTPESSLEDDGSGMAQHLCQGTNRDSRLSPFNAQLTREVMNELACRRLLSLRKEAVNPMARIKDGITCASVVEDNGLGPFTVYGDYT